MCNNLFNVNPAVAKSIVLSSSLEEIETLGTELREFLMSKTGLLVSENKRRSLIVLYQFCRSCYRKKNKKTIRA
jgi:hypothetical protein